MIKNLPHELHQWESEHTKGSKLYANITLKLEGEKCFKIYFNILERKYAKSNNLY